MSAFDLSKLPTAKFLSRHPIWVWCKTVFWIRPLGNFSSFFALKAKNSFQTLKLLQILDSDKTSTAQS
jgi:hypothetical protein